MKTFVTGFSALCATRPGKTSGSGVAGSLGAGLAGMLLAAVPMASSADALLTSGRPQLVAIESSLRQLPSVRVFLADYLIPPFRGLSFRVQWTADGQPMDPNLDRVRAECIFKGSEALSCEALRNWFGDVPRYSRQQVTTQDRQAFFIPNMEYDTEYCFRFQADDEPWSAWTCARTPPKPALPIAPARPTLETIAESTETRVENAAHPFAIYVKWDAVPGEAGLTVWYAVEKRNDDGIFIGDSNWVQRVEAVSSYHQTLELPGYDPDGEYFIRVCAVNVSGRSCSPAAKTLGRAWADKSTSHQGLADAVFSTRGQVVKNDHSAHAALYRPDPAVASTVAESDQSIRASTALAQPPPKSLGRVQRAEGVPNATLGKSFCEMAAAAREAGRPTAAALQQRCDAELAALPAVDAAAIGALAAAGAQIAQVDPEVSTARALVADADYQRGFDIASGMFGDPAQGGQGKTQVDADATRIRDSLSAAGQRGFDGSVEFHLTRK